MKKRLKYIKKPNFVGFAFYIPSMYVWFSEVGVLIFMIYFITVMLSK